MEDLIGFDRETIDSGIDALASYVHPADREDFLESSEAAIKKVGRVVTEVRIQREDGTQIWVEARGNVQEGADGNRQMVGIITDITDRKKREEELIQYEAAFKKAGDGMTITDDEARILDVNEAAAHLYGEDTQDLVGRSMKEFLPDDFDFEAEWGEIQAAKMKRDEMKIVSADGGENPVEYTAKTDIVPGQHLIVSRKITEQQKEKLGRTSQFLKDSQEVAHFGGWEVDLRSETMRWSDELYRIHGLPLDANPTPEEGIEFYHPDDRDTIREAFDQLTTEGEPYDLELRIVTADDEVRWVVTRGEPRYEDDDIAAVHGTFQDITERKEREQALQRQNSRLDEFASVISHDLRNPLNVAMGRIQLAQDEYDSDHLDITMNAIGRMESIIEDSLVLARKGQPVADREWIQMQSLLTDCWEMVETPDCSLEIDDRFEVNGERSRLKHVFENLFRNSVEHGNGKSTVRIGLLDATGFYVEDDGPGIPEDERKKVLDAGFTTNEEGTGFGLAIVNRIAVAHGWDLTIVDGIDGGVRFEFSNVNLRSQSEIPSD